MVVFNVVFPAQAEYSYFPPILGEKYFLLFLNCFYERKSLSYFLRFVHFFCAVYYRYVFHVPFIDLSSQVY